MLSLTFLFVHLAPGDPASLYIRPEIAPEVVENIREQMGLHRPLWQQYLAWLGEFARGRFGVSFVQHRPVQEVLREAIPNTLLLTGTSFLLQLMLGILLGGFMAVRCGSLLDRGARLLLLIIYSIPGFWLAILAVSFVAVKWGWLPSSHMQSIAAGPGFWQLCLDRARHLVLPATILSLPFIAFTAKIIRGTLLDVLGRDYIRTAKAYGLRRRRIFFKYALKNALLPLASLAGTYLPFLLGGAVIIETVFAWPGMGRITIDALFAHDYPVILATTFIAALTVVLGNLFSDLLYAVLDPRIKLGANA